MAKAGLQIEGIIKRYSQQLEELGIKPEGMILYGSFAKGTAEEGSDIDLLIVSENFQGMNIRQRSELLGMAAARILSPIQAQGLTPQEVTENEEDSFLVEILQSGIVLLEKR
jgi:predicted nucleotidyltransferase